ncbi:Transmembrane channel-like protein 3 [Stylophora pistillata]|uniref:Transmembrane channel-like protein 3 n=1 Tax=Stylophora pistillata TaxID=50429 RepID=A0A2B4T1Y7_STYPI|nr:Transmembrane channel-like protein 3 [Stylophora pistillata]
MSDISTNGNRTSEEIRGPEEDARLEMCEINARTSLTNTPEEPKESNSPSRSHWLRKRSPTSAASEKPISIENNCEPSVSTLSEVPNKTPTEEVFTDVFENIQLQLDVIKGIKEKPWTMDKKLQILSIFGILFFLNSPVYTLADPSSLVLKLGHFGAGIGSFFLFLRSLTWINFILLTFITIFVIAPQLMSPSTALSIPENEKHTAQRLTAVLDAKEQMVEAVEKGKTINKKSLIALRVCANMLVLGVLSASAYLIYLVVKRSDDRDKEGRSPTVLEQYESKGTASDVSPTSGVINSTATPVTTFKTNTTVGSLCWETTVGQELFKLTIIDLVALVFSVLTGDLFVSLTVRFLNCFQGRLLDLEKILGYPEFKLAENVLQLINSQGLIWMGLVFSPGLIMLNILKLVIIMYLRSWAVMVTNVPPMRIFKASQRFYLVLLLVMLFLCMLAVGYAAVEIEPSKWCGPFRGKPNMYRVLTESIDNGPALLDTIVDYLSGPSVVIPAFILMSIAIYYYRSEANYLRRSNRELGLQLQYERTEDRKKIFKSPSERYSNNPEEEKVPGLPGGQPRYSKTKIRNKSRQVSDNRTNDIKDRELPRTVVKKSSQMKQVRRHEDMVPIVTCDGVIEETSTDSVINSTQDHREVKVIIHRTSSSSSSSASSVRSVDQRITIPRKKHLRSRDHVHESQRNQNNIENTESEIQNIERNSTSCSIQESSHCEESIALQVTAVDNEAKNNGQVCKTSQQTIKEGGSLAAMFDS